MSRVTDEKVVEMRFDNQNFENNVQTSLKTIDKLKGSLKFEDSAKSLQSLEDQSKKVTLSGLSNAVDTVKVKFSALETAAITAIANFTNKAVEAGTELVRSLSVDNIAEGWGKFVSMSDAVGTLIHQGFSMDEVEAQMERLMWYTDETSYNFVDMVNEIGKFTAAGQGLEDSVTAMEGIANWAALSGVGPTRASQVMYQLSQAMGQGYMALADFKSVQNANMGNIVFQQKAIEKALKMNTIEAAPDVGEGYYRSLLSKKATDPFGVGDKGFSGSLTYGRWLTADVLMEIYKEYAAANETIQKYAEEHEISTYEAIHELKNSLPDLDTASREVMEFGINALEAAQETRTFQQALDYTKDAVSTQWMKIFQSIFGNYNESVTLWSDLSEKFYSLFVEDTERTANSFQVWKKELGGREDFLAIWDNIWGSYDEVEERFDGLLGIIGLIKSAIQEIFPPKKAADIKAISEAIKDFTSRFKLTSDQAKNLKDAVKGIASIFKVLGQVIKAVLTPFKMFKETGGSFLDILISIVGWIGRVLSEFAKWITDNNILVNAVKGIIYIIGAAIKLAEKLFQKITGMNFAEFGEKLKSGAWSVWEFIKGVGEKVKEFFSGLFSEDTKNKAGEFFSGFGDGLKNSFSKVSDIFAKIKSAIGKFIDKVKELFSKLPKIDFTGANTFSEKIQRVFEPIKVLFEKLKDVIEWVWKAIKIVFTKIKDIFMKIVEFFKGIFGETAEEVKKIDFERILNIIKSVIEIGILNNIRKLLDSTKGILDNFKKIGETFGKTLDAIGNAFERNKKKYKSEQVKDIAESILMIAAALVLIALIPSEKLGPSIGTLVGAIATLIGSFVLLDKLTKKSSSTRLNKLTTAILKLSAAMLVVAVALKMVAKLPVAGIIAGGIALNLTLGALVGAVVGLDKLTKHSDSSRIMKLAETMIVLAASLAIVAMAIKKVAKLDPVGVAVGTAALLLTLGGMIGAVIALDKATKGDQSTRIMKLAEMVVVLSAAMAILSLSIKKIAKLDPKGVAVATVALVVLLTALVSAVVAMDRLMRGTDLTKSTGAIVSLSAAMLLIAFAMKTLAKLSWEELGIAIVGFLVAITSLVVALRALDGVSVKGAAGMVLIASAMLMLVPAIYALGKMPWYVLLQGIIGLVAVLGVFVVAGYALTPVVSVLFVFGEAMALLGVAVIAFGVGLGILSATLGPFAVSFALFADQIVEAIIVLIKALPRFIAAFVVGLMESAGDIIKGLGVLLDILLEFLVDAVPKLVTFLVDMFLQIIHLTLSIIGKHMYEIVTDIFFIFHELIRALSDAFKSLSTEEWTNMILTLVTAMGLLGLLIPVLVEAAIVTSLLPIIGLNLSLFAASIIPFLAVLKTVDENTIKTAEMLADVVLKMTAASILDAITSWFTGGVDFQKFADQFETLGDGIARFANKVKGIDAAQTEAAASAAYILTVVANNLPRTGGFLQDLVGTQSLSSFAQELETMGPSIAKFSKYAEKVNGEAVEGAANAAKTILEVANNLPRQGGYWQKIAGSKDLSKFAQELNDMGPSMVSFSKNAQKVKSQAVIGASDAAQAIVNVANNLPKQGGLWQKISGSKDLSKFAKELDDMGPSMVSFSKNAKQIDSRAVTGASNAAQSILKVANNLPKQGGIWQSIAGTNSLSAFAEELANFGPHYVNFSKSVKDAVYFNYNQVANATLKMVEVANQLPIANEGFLSWFLSTRKLSLSDFAQEMEWAGPHFANFASSLSDVTVDETALTEVVGAITEMIKVSNDLPSANNGFLSWFLSTRQLSLSQFANEMSVAAPHFKDFCSAISGISFNEGDKEKSEYLMSLLNAMLDASKEMPKASSGLIGLITGEDMKLSQFGSELASFGPDYATFITSFSDLSKSDLVKGTLAAKPLEFLASFMVALSMLNAEKWVSVADVLIGKQKTLKEFGKELAEFGPSYKTFLEAFSDIPADIATNIGNVLSTMDPLAKLLSVFLGWKENGILTFFFGEQVPLSTIGSELKDFGYNLRQLADYFSSSTLTLKHVAPIKQLVDILLSLIDAMPEEIDPYQGSLIDVWGEDLVTFGTSLKTFFDIFFANPLWSNGNGLVLVNTVIDTISKLVDASINVLDTLSALNDIDSDKVAKTSGEFTTFITGMRQLILTFAHGEEGLDNETLTKFDEFIRNLIQIAEDAAAVNVDDVTAVLESLTGIPAESVKKMIEDVEASPDKMTEAVNNLMDACKNSIDTKGAEAKTAFDDFIASFKNKLTNMTTQMELKSVGVTIINLIKEGLTSSKKDLSDAIKTLLSDVFDLTVDYVKTDEVQNKLTQTGKEIIEGIEKGLDDKKEDLKKKGKNLAKTVSDSFSETLEIQSPSKVMRRLGEYAGEGLVLGLSSYGVKVSDVSEELGLEAERGMTEAIAKVRDTILADPDDTLTIRPVLDLSEIQNGTDRLYSMMSGANRYLSSDIGFVDDVAQNVRNVEASRANRVDSTDQNPQTGKETIDSGTTFNNTFNIQGDDPQTIATEVSRIIQRQTERKAAVWGS